MPSYFGPGSRGFYSLAVVEMSYLVACPLCKAKAGQRCKQINNNGMRYHIERQDAFIRSPLSEDARKADEAREVFV